jgi:hypothetical protein
MWRDTALAANPDLRQVTEEELFGRDGVQQWHVVTPRYEIDAFDQTWQLERSLTKAIAECAVGMQQELVTGLWPDTIILHTAPRMYVAQRAYMRECFAWLTAVRVAKNPQGVSTQIDDEQFEVATADGVTIVPGMTVHNAYEQDFIITEVRDDLIRGRYDSPDTYTVETLYADDLYADPSNADEARLDREFQEAMAKND